MKKYMPIMALLGVILFLSISGCINDQSPTVISSEGPPTEEKVINVYAAYGGLDTIAEEFEKDTGIKVNYVSMSSGEALSRLMAEKNNPSCDVWFGGGIDAFIKAKNEKLLTSYESPNAKYIDSKFVDEEHYWTGVSLVTIGVLENTQLIKDKNLPEPKTWDDLIKPEYKGELIASNPTISGTAYFTICGILQMKGKDEGWIYLDKFYGNTPFLTKRGSGPSKKVISGEYAYGVAPDPHSKKIKNPDLPIKAIYLDKVVWWPSPVAIIKDSKHPNNAKTFVDWALSERGQKILMSASPRVPVRSDIKTLEGVPNPSELDFIDMDFVYWGEHRDEVLNEWKNRYQSITTQ
ncbi:ABC transporter substrate-binding protein [Methanococcus aeolicus]|uniref:ABC transporter substrate-binding protein n=1 Tax=Methanococcus aeolicus TaxID=42879 RepID=UPI0036F2B938